MITHKAHSSTLISNVVLGVKQISFWHHNNMRTHVCTCDNKRTHVYACDNKHARVTGRVCRCLSSDLARQYRTKISEIDLKRVQFGQLSKEYETKLRSKEVTGASAANHFSQPIHSQSSVWRNQSMMGFVLGPVNYFHENHCCWEHSAIKCMNAIELMMIINELSNSMGVLTLCQWCRIKTINSAHCQTNVVLQEEQLKLKQELAELAISMNMEAQKGRTQDVTYKGYVSDYWGVFRFFSNACSMISWLRILRFT